MATRAEVDSYIAARINDNSAGEISPLDMRQSTGAILDFVEQEVQNATEIPPLQESLWINDVIIRDPLIDLILTDTSVMAIIAERRYSIKKIIMQELLEITQDIFIRDCPNLETVSCISLNNCEGDILILPECESLTLVRFNNLVTVGGSITIMSIQELFTLNLSSLTVVSGALTITECISLEELDLSSINTCTLGLQVNSKSLIELQIGTLQTSKHVYVQYNDVLELIDLSSITDCESINISNNPVLEAVYYNNSCNCIDINLSQNALTQTSVNNILLAVDAAGFEDGYLQLNGGTNSAPTGGASNSNYLSLLAKGWSVTIN